MSSSHSSSSSDLESTLRKLSKEQLIELLIRAVSLAPEIRPLVAQNPDKKDSSDLVENARDAISTAVEDVDWEEWHHSGRLVDYDPVQQSLKVLQLSGFSEEVLELGLELIEQSREQIEQYDRDGEIVDEVHFCMDIVLEAFNTVDWPNHRKLLWLLDAERNDDFYLMSAFSEILKNPHPPEDWSLVADALLEQMNRSDEENGYNRRMVDETMNALTRAGRDPEVLDLCKTVAITDGDYLRLVKLLLDKEDYQEAEEWIHRGLAAEKEASSRSAGQLRECLLELRKKQENWDEALFMQIENFVQNASLELFKNCHYSAEKLNNWSTVRPLLLDFLIEGKNPWDQDTWPFQNKGETVPIRDSGYPNLYLLVDTAIYERNPAEVLKWYDLKSGSKGHGFHDRFRTNRQTKSVADAVQEFAPERTIAIWQELAEEQIAVTKPEAYVEAGRYLLRMKAVMSQNNMTAQWSDYIQSLRTTYRRRPRLLEVLDGLPRT